MVLYELLFDRIPVNYSKCFASDIARGWTSSEEFGVYPLLYKKKGARIVEEIYSWISVHTICIKQKDRLKIESLK